MTGDLESVQMNAEREIPLQYRECVADLLEHDRVQKLEQYIQHYHTTRLQHSLNVSYYSYLICKKFGWDYRSAARAGLLHDLFYYDWRAPKKLRGNHAIWHPLVAYDNARKICELNEIEKDAIVKHMWPCNIIPPKYKESYVITFVDKYCAVAETFQPYYLKVKQFRKVHA